ncbi:MAG: hypothetical protein JRH01_12040 [Deltaproteobacteria bacterium]|nr:hypothetical protein [Deltaproteobacteria bacterium]
MHGPYPIGGARWWLREDADLETARPAVLQVQAALASGSLVDRKSGRRKSLFEVQLSGSAGSEAARPPDHLLKRNAYTGLARLRRSVSGSKARIELLRAEQAASRGIPTPIPLAAGEVARAGLLDHCLLLMPILEGVTDLRAHWEGHTLAAPERQELASTLGRFTRQFLEAGLFQDDFAPNNVLIRPGSPPELWVIDFERAVLQSNVSEADAARVLAKLQREMSGTSRSDEMRFLRSFAADDAVTWLQRVNAEAPRLLARDLAHLERTLRRPGRRFTPVRDAAFRGWLRKDVPLAQLTKSRDATAAPEERRDLPPLSASAARRLFATAILLGRRGLGPKPDGVWTSRDRSCLLYAPAARTAGTPGAPASRALLRRLLRLAEIAPPFRPEDLGLAVPLGGEAAAAWLAPERVLIRGVAASPEALRSALEDVR